MRWLLVLIPAVVGVVSFVVSRTTEDFRSSGLMAGVALSVVLAGILLAVRRPWVGRARAGAWAARGAVGLVLVVGPVGLVEGLPYLLRERFGLLLSADDRGLLAVASVDGGFVAVGHPETGAAWTSPDGLTWTPAPLPPALVDLELRALVPAAGTHWVIAQDDTAAGLLAEVPGLGQDWVTGSRFAHEDEDLGQKPQAAAEFGDQLLTFGSTYGNDVTFFRGDPRQTLVPAGPEPAGDRGYSARDLACSDTACVAVGQHWEPAAAFWHTTDGHDWELVQLDRTAVAATGVVPITDGWLAVGHDDGTAVTWRSADGRTWERDTAVEVPESVVEGLSVVRGKVAAHGHDPRSDLARVWILSDDGWARIDLDLGAPPGSRIRGLAYSDETTVAAGVVGDSLQAAVWVSTAGSTFRPIPLKTPTP